MPGFLLIDNFILSDGNKYLTRVQMFTKASYLESSGNDLLCVCNLFDRERKSALAPSLRFIPQMPAASSARSGGN